jgi:hypothetical protein
MGLSALTPTPRSRSSWGPMCRPTSSRCTRQSMLATTASHLQRRWRMRSRCVARGGGALWTGLARQACRQCKGCLESQSGRHTARVLLPHTPVAHVAGIHSRRAAGGGMRWGRAQEDV